MSKNSERQTITINAVRDEQLWDILSHIGLLAALDAGSLRCYVTGKLLNRHSVGGLVGTPRGARPIADGPVALSRGGDKVFLEQLEQVMALAMEVWRSERAAANILARETLTGVSSLDKIARGEADVVIKYIQDIGRGTWGEHT